MAKDELHIPKSIWDAMRAHVLTCLPEEACGLLAGVGHEAQRLELIENVLHSPVRFRMDPGAQVRSMTSFEEQGLDLVGIFHSHPDGPRMPSAVDLAEAAYPEAAHLIWSPTGERWICRGFRLESGVWREVRILIGP